MTDSTHDDNVNRILESAERLFRVYGYSKTNVADIARDLGMSPANIYRFFRSKSDIHEALARKILAGKDQLSHAIAALDLPAGERLRRYVLEMHRVTVETLMDAEKVHEMVVIAMEQQWGVIEAHIEGQCQIVEAIIRDGLDRSEFPPQDAHLAAKCFTSAMTALVHPQCVSQCPPRNNRATPEEIAEFLLRALKYVQPCTTPTA
nr:TetR/AcrR family transcriptional regulator [uncultured Gellertiella sp.]